MEDNFKSYTVINKDLSLSKESKVRQDALNTIKYTLLLNYNSPTISTNEKDIIDEIIKSVKVCCKDLLNPNSSRFTYNFFGDCFPEDTKNCQLLNYEPLNIEIKANNINLSSSLFDMVVYNSLLKGYHAITMDLFSNVAVTPYTICNKFGNNGIQTLFKKNQLIIDASGNISFPNVPHGRGINCGKASDFQKGVNNRIKHFKDILSFVYVSNDNESRYKLPTTNIVSILSELNLKDLKQVLTYHNRDDNNDAFYESFCSLHKHIMKKSNIDGEIIKSNITDTVYELYLLEEIFGINKLYTMLKRVSDLQKDNKYNLCDKTTLKSLCSVRALCNSFSSQAFINYAFDCFNHTDSYRDFWNHRDLQYRDDSSDVKKHFTRIFPRGFQFHKWIEQFSLFTNFYSKYIIPITEWTFTLMLLEYVEKKYPTMPHNKHLEKALEIISNYITANYKEILWPITCELEDDIYNVITTKNTSPIYYSFKADELKFITKTFYKDNNINLNLANIGPDYFKANHNRVTGNNFKDIQDFYLDLQRYDHFTNPITTENYNSASKKKYENVEDFFASQL